MGNTNGPNNTLILVHIHNIHTAATPITIIMLKVYVDVVLVVRREKGYNNMVCWTPQWDTTCIDGMPLVKVLSSMIVLGSH